MNSSIKKTIATTLGIFIIFCFWQVLSVIKQDAFLFPGLISIFERLIEIITSSADLSALFTTLYRLFIVIVIAVGIALILAFIYFKFPITLNFFRPIINVLKAAPFAIISIYIFFAIDKKIAPQIVTFLVVLPIAFEGLIAAIDNMDKSIKDELSLLNIDAFRKYLQIYLPICFPYIVTTLLQSFGLGLKVMIMSEYMCQIEGTVGQILINIKYNYEFDYLLAWLIIIVAIVCIIDLLIRIISSKLVKNN